MQVGWDVGGTYSLQLPAHVLGALIALTSSAPVLLQSGAAIEVNICTMPCIYPLAQCYDHPLCAVVLRKLEKGSIIVSTHAWHCCS